MLIVSNQIISNGPSDIWGIFRLAVIPMSNSLNDLTQVSQSLLNYYDKICTCLMLFCFLFSLDLTLCVCLCVFRSVPICWSSCALTWSGSVLTTPLKSPKDRPSRRLEDTFRPDCTCRGKTSNRYTYVHTVCTGTHIETPAETKSCRKTYTQMQKSNKWVSQFSSLTCLSPFLRSTICSGV